MSAHADNFFNLLYQIGNLCMYAFIYACGMFFLTVFLAFIIAPSNLDVSKCILLPILLGV